MKNVLTFISLSIFLLGSITNAQTTSDALSLASSQNLGTARFNALSGAFGALGGDLTSIGNNPAGSAVFLNSYGSLTLSQGGSVFRTNYFGNETEKDDANFNLNQIGGVLVLKNSAEGAFKKITLAINYNITRDFNEEYSIIGEINNSIGSYFTEQANGIPLGALITTDANDFINLYESLGNNTNLGSRAQQTLLAYEAFIIDPVDETNDNGTLYTSNATNGDNFQDILVSSTGSSSKTSLNVGAELQNNLYLGANINIHNINRRKQTSFIEDNGFARITYEISDRIYGNGISLSLGAIYKATKNIRVGLSYNTPTWFYLTTQIDQFIQSEFAESPANPNSERDDNLEISDPNILYTAPSYVYRTPGIFSVSTAYVFGKKGLLSAEYSYQDFSNINYGSDNSESRFLNNQIENTFQAVNTIKIGGEYRINNWRLRGGINHSSTPYKNDNDKEGETNGFSLGTGYDWGKWKLDIGYNHFETSTTNIPFENAAYSNAGTTERKGDSVSVTLGVNF